MVLIRPPILILILMVITTLFLGLSSSHALLNDIRIRLNNRKEKEQSVKECYQYEQLLNPPIMNN